MLMPFCANMLSLRRSLPARASLSLAQVRVPAF